MEYDVENIVENSIKVKQRRIGAKLRAVSLPLIAPPGTRLP
jgi:hypothetical protein